MDRYPLRVNIPRAEERRGRLGIVAHTEFVIVIDDCGKAYLPRYRRFKTFLWLHSQLRRQQLTEALPELPPKKRMGNMEETFVDGRRAQLESYLQALLRLEGVIMADHLWVFLDVDNATVAVPRFLCRLQTPAGRAEGLFELQKVAIQNDGENLFRLCNQSVISALTDIAQTEARDPIAVRVGQQPDARLHCRLRLCHVLHPLLQNDRAELARNGLMAGLFGALLKLLTRSTEDAESARTSFHHDGAQGPHSQLKESARKARDLHNQVSDQVATCLTVFIDQTQGKALVSFCEQDGGLEGLRRVVDNERLHLAAANLLWHGMQYTGVVSALTDGVVGGFQLLNRLTTSQDLKAKIMAALCVGCIVRSDVVSVEDRQECLACVAKTEIHNTLDDEEMAAVRRGAEAVLRSEGGVTSGSDGAEIPCPPQASPRRDAKLAQVLQFLCRKEGVVTLQPLLGSTGGMAGDGFDAVSALVVAILDHFTQHFAADHARLSALAPLEEQLRRIVDTPDDEEDQHRMSTRIRAARALIRFWSCRSGDAAGEPFALEHCMSRARALQVLIRYSTMRRERSEEGLDKTHNIGEMQGEQARQGRLTEPPCVPEERLDAFARQVGTLAAAREELGRGLDAAQVAQAGTVASLEQRAMKHNEFRMKVESFDRELQKADFAQEAHDAQAEEQRREAEASAAQHEVAQAKAELREAEALCRRCAEAAREAEGRAEVLCARQRELANIRTHAPSELERAKSEDEDEERKAHNLAERLEGLGDDLDRAVGQARCFRNGERDAEAALQCAETVRRLLEAMKADLSNELVLSREEIHKLQDMEKLFQPARPARIMRTSFEDSSEQGGGADVRDVSATFVADPAQPSWEEDALREKRFREEPNFRTLTGLRDQRALLWQQELAWLKESANKLEARAAQLEQEIRDGLEWQQHIAERRRRMKERIENLADQEAHDRRHAEACCEADEARRESHAAADEASQAEARLNAARSNVERREAILCKAEVDRASASSEASKAADLCLRVRREFSKRCRELEEVGRRQLQDWQVLDVHTNKVELMQDRVWSLMCIEGHGRAALREQVSLLIADLHELDAQLQITPRGSHGEATVDASESPFAPEVAEEAAGHNDVDRGAYAHDHQWS